MRLPNQYLSTQIEAAFEQRLQQARVPAPHHPQYHKWIGLFVYFCQKFRYPPAAPTSLGPFLTKPAASVV
jgi:hypothetical protein